MRSHAAHDAVRRALSGYQLVLTGPSLSATYSALGLTFTLLPA